MSKVCHKLALRPGAALCRCVVCVRCSRGLLAFLGCTPARTPETWASGGGGLGARRPSACPKCGQTVESHAYQTRHTPVFPSFWIVKVFQNFSPMVKFCPDFCGRGKIAKGLQRVSEELFISVVYCFNLLFIR